MCAAFTLVDALFAAARTLLPILEAGKLKALLRKAAARTVDDLWDAIDALTSTECENYFAAAGYDWD